MNKEQLLSAREDVLFASEDPVSIDRLSRVFEISPEKVEATASALEKKLEDNKSGIKLIRLENKYQLATRNEFAEYIKKALDITRTTPPSPAALEVLAVIAYNQPVTRSFVEQVRGVDCSGVITTLIEKELIEERGRLELPGKPLLYGRTDNLSRCFSISDLSELPPLPKDNVRPADMGEQLVIEETQQAEE